MIKPQMITIPIMVKMKIPSAILSKRCIRRNDRDADVVLEVCVWVAVPVSFSFHGDQLLEQPRNRLFRQ